MKSHSRVISLNPFIGKDGLLRISIIITKAPLILDSKDVLIHLLVCSLYVSLCHCGPSLLLSSAGTTAHILGARRLVRDICRRCVICRRTTAKAEQQQMGQLPAPRVTPSPPFSKTGMDFAGPFLLKRGYTRKPVIIKAYICILVPKQLTSSWCQI